MPHYEYQCRRCQGLTFYLLAEDKTMRDEQSQCHACRSKDTYLKAWYRNAHEHVVSLQERVDELELRIDGLEHGEEPWDDFPTRARNH